jgi:ArsR family transcriptional regulator
LEALLVALRAAAEPTRLRLLAACASGEMTVGELTEVLGQSQPRVSRHLKLLCEAGLLDRFKEGTWVFYRMADERRSPVRDIVAMIPRNDPIITRDGERIEAIKLSRYERAAMYFRTNAQAWDRIRSLHVDEREVERALMGVWPENKVRDLLDIGTGTGRLLQLFGPMIERGVGIDLSHDMLAYARANLDDGNLLNCQVRHGDMYRLQLDGESFDAVTVHQVLHYADEPARVIFEATRVLRPRGRLVIVDFAPHRLEQLRADHAHRRLGFADDEVTSWCREAGLETAAVQTLEGNPLTVKIWVADKSRRPPADVSTDGIERVHREAVTT